MEFNNIFSYKDYEQETTTKDRKFFDCVFINDFHEFKKGESVKRIDIDWRDYTMYIYDDNIYEDNDDNNLCKVYSPKWFQDSPCI